MASPPNVHEARQRAPAIRSVTKEEPKFNPGKPLFAIISEDAPLDLIDLPPSEEVPMMDYDEFLTIAKTQEFLQDLKNSIDELLAYKISFYAKLMEAQRELLKNTEAMVSVLISKGTSPEETERLCPGNSSARSALALAQEISKTVIARRATLSVNALAVGMDKAFTDSKFGLASLKGRKEIKDYVTSKIYAFSKNSKLMGDTFKNIALYGSPGSGKTRVAQVISWVYYHLFLVEKKIPKITSRADLIAGYTGQTAPRVRGVFFESLGGVLFIDEAYQMGQGKYGKEGLSELVGLMDQFRGVSFCIVAGYKEQMLRKMMSKNKGLHRRFPFQFTLDDFSIEELSYILLSALQEILPEGEIRDADRHLIYSVLSSRILDDPNFMEHKAGDATQLAVDIATRASMGGGWCGLTDGQKYMIVNEEMERISQKKRERHEYE